MDPNRFVEDKDQDKHNKPGIPRPGQQPDQQQQPNAPPQPQHRQTPPTSQWIAPTTGNPDLDPVGLHQTQRIDLREHNPLMPQGMLYNPNQLLDHQRFGNRPEAGLPPGARFDPFGPPDPSLVGPGRGPLPTSQFGVPDPDHLPPPGMPQQPRQLGDKSLKSPWPGSPFPPPGGAGGGPFL